MVNPLIPVFAGYLFTYYNTKKSEERKAQIERINEQVKELYGPLLATLNASKSSYDAMVRQHSPDGTQQTFLRERKDHPEGPVGQAYRTWMREVLQPLNDRAAAIIVDHADLLESSIVEPVLLQLVAHMAAYKVVLEQWRSGDISAWSAVPFPNGVLGYVEREFRHIKRRQARLLGIKNGRDTPLSKL